MVLLCRYRSPSRLASAALLLGLLVIAGSAQAATRETLALGAATNATASMHDATWTTGALRLSLSAGSLPLLQSFADPGMTGLAAGWRFSMSPWAELRWQGSFPPAGPIDSPWEASTPVPLAPLHVLGWRGPASGDPGYSPTLLPMRFPATPSRSSWRRPPGVPLHWSNELVPEAKCSRDPVRFVRYKGEVDRFPLLDCDDAVAEGALDRLSVMARPPGTQRPSLPLPDLPAGDAERGEWVSSIRMLDPRLIWRTQQIADSFPGRSIYIVSGYRSGAEEGNHGLGRALDIQVMGVDKESVYRVCRRIPDTGCGYYPHHEMVHIDVRPPGTGRRTWIDVSLPGAPSEYVAAWPGL